MTEVIQPLELLDTRRRGYSQARIDDGQLFISGIASRGDDDWVVVGEGIEAQTRRVFDILEVILEEVGGDLTDVSKLTTYLVNLQRDMDGYAAVKDGYFEEPFPCSTLLGIDQLAVDGCLVEVDAEATL